MQQAHITICVSAKPVIVGPTENNQRAVVVAFEQDLEQDLDLILKRVRDTFLAASDTFTQ